jgi:hypothetical protein
MPGRQNHYDFLLETAGFFVTIELKVLPWEVSETHGRVLSPHRLAYWELEGPVSGNRGIVKRITRGHYQCVSQAHGCWELRLDSAEVQTVLMLTAETSAAFAQLPSDTIVRLAR